MIVVTLKNGQRAEVPTGATVTAGTFPSEAGANPAPALLVQDTSGQTVATFRSADVSWFATDSAVAVA